MSSDIGDGLVTMQEIISACAKAWGIGITEVYDKRNRQAEKLGCLQAICMIGHDYAGYSYPEITKALGKKSHSGPLGSARKARAHVLHNRDTQVIRGGRFQRTPFEGVVDLAMASLEYLASTRSRRRNGDRAARPVDDDLVSGRLRDKFVNEWKNGVHTG